MLRLWHSILNSLPLLVTNCASIAVFFFQSEVNKGPTKISITPTREKVKHKDFHFHTVPYSFSATIHKVLTFYVEHQIKSYNPRKLQLSAPSYICVMIGGDELIRQGPDEKGGSCAALVPSHHSFPGQVHLSQYADTSYILQARTGLSPHLSPKQ